MRKAVAKAAMAAMVIVAIVAGGSVIYFYTAPHASPATLSTTRSSSGTVPSSGGYQDSEGMPYGSWATYLGYIPAGYVPVPHQANAPTFPCPSGMQADQCATFQKTCGNAVCDPNESCTSCPLDCAPTGNLLCDPYTGRPGMPASVCQAIVNNNNAGA